VLDEPRLGAPRKLDDARIEQLIATTSTGARAKRFTPTSASWL
jgi:hypothetical protein